MNRRDWILASGGLALAGFLLGVTVGATASRPRPTPRHVFRSLGGDGSARVVVDEGTSDVYVISSKGVRHLGNILTTPRISARTTASLPEGPR